MSDRPDAVLLDVGGVFSLPDPERLRGAFERGGFDAGAADLDRAHYEGATCFTIDYEGELPWHDFWDAYLRRYAEVCGVPDDLRDDVHEHLDAEFATAALWTRVVPGSVDALRALAETGVRLGIVSNSDGSVGARLREQEIVQVGPGIGVEVECVIDSGEVGVEKPDPRIFKLALDALDLDGADVWYVGDMPGIDVVGARAAGLRPFVMDPYSLHLDATSDRINSLLDLACVRARTGGGMPRARSSG
jgi:putative hydrolase of the HAD superfamily